jgi:hypothetical protein
MARLLPNALPADPRTAAIATAAAIGGGRFGVEVSVVGDAEPLPRRQAQLRGA